MSGAEVPRAIWVPADPSNYRLRPQAQGGVYRKMVEHITDGHGDPVASAQALQTPNHGTSFHFSIGQDGTIVQAVSLRFAAQHAHAANAYSVGIEHCCRSPGSLGPDDPGLPPSMALYQASGWLNAYLLKAAGLPIVRGDTIDGHKQSDPQTTHDDCPDGAPWNWPLFLQLVTEQYAQIGEVAPLV